MNARCRILLSSLAALLLWVGQSASATVTTDLGTYTGPNVDFTLIEETTQDPLWGPSDDGDAPLYGTPTGSGNSLVFTPPSFLAQGSGGASDEDHATLNIALESVNPYVDALDMINITEFGDYTLETIPLPGQTPPSPNTSVYMQMTGSIQVLEVNIGGVLTDVSADPNATFAIAGVFNVGTPSGSGATSLDISGYQGAGTWSAADSLDITGLLAGAGIGGTATKAIIALDNKLWAFSESGTIASVQKKNAGDGVVIEVVPEPTTGLLLAGGLFALAIRKRLTRA
jgi:hypothetical protein